MEYQPPDTNPLVAAHPRAYRVCVFLGRATRVCGWTLVVLVAALSACIVIGVLAGDSTRPTLEVAAAVIAFLLVVSVLGLAAAAALHWLVVALFFARYSLAQLLGVVLLAGACVTAILQLPDILKLLPVFGLATLGIFVAAYVAEQDPAGLAQVPAFLRESLERQKQAEQQRQDEPKEQA
jgi:hypothetical protein